MAASAPREGPQGLGRITQSIVEALGIAILTGKYPPHALLPAEAALTAQYRASRSVLREAIKVLSAKGLVAARKRLGTTVTPPAQWNLFDPDVLRWTLQGELSIPLLVEFTEVRLGIEPSAAALAASRATPENVLPIEEGIARMVAAERGEDDQLLADIAFHAAILEASGNRFYSRMKPFVETALQFSIRLTNNLSRDHDAKIDAHRRILEAIKAGDVATARVAAELMLLETRNLIRSVAGQAG